MAVNKDKSIKKNPWYYSFYTGTITNGKRDREKVRGFRTKKEAEAAEVEHKSRLKNGTYFNPQKTPFGEFISEWCKTKRAISEETREMYENNIRLYIKPSLGDIPLSKLNAQHIEDFITFMIEEKGLGEWSVKRTFSNVNTCLNDAVKKKLIEYNPCSVVDKPKVNKRIRPIWTPEFSFDFLEKTKGTSRYWIATLLAIMTGMRPGEVLGLRWSDIDFKNKTLSIKQTVTKNRRIKEGAKTKSSVRSIALSTETIEALREHRSLILQERLSLGSEYQMNDLVVCTSFGGPSTMRSIQRMWERQLKKYEAPHIAFYDLRHTHVAFLIQQKVHIKVISERLGHTSVSFTLDTYGHLMPNMQSDAAESLDQLQRDVLSTTK
ncbi:site-specific integrase [Acinetobacter sp. CUI P1]|nr:site-specific integrase [Acinetobacter sp. CUI P1]